MSVSAILRVALVVCGMVLIAVGLAMLSVPLCFVFCGVACVSASYVWQYLTVVKDSTR